jgi:hypothetical protein
MSATAAKDPRLERVGLTRRLSLSFANTGVPGHIPPPAESPRRYSIAGIVPPPDDTSPDSPPTPTYTSSDEEVLLEGLIGSETHVNEEILDFNMEMLSVFDNLTEDLSLSTAVTKRINRQKQKLKKILEERAQAIRKDMKKAPFIKLRDKISFVLGVVNVALTAFLVGALPHWMPLFYTLKAIVLLTIRWAVFRSKRWHYFLFDFCYFANILVLLYLHLFPTSDTLFIICFAFSTGPLAWAILTWRNSLVFHSLDKTTSLFIHLTPGILMWTLRWFANDPYSLATYHTCRDQDISFAQLTFLPLVPYLLWQVMYYVKVQVLSARKVIERDYQTSFRWFREKDKGTIGKALQAKSEQYQLFTYIGYQFLYTIITMLPTYLYFHYFWAHTAFLCFMMLISAWNGANFYFDVFSTRYAESLEKGNERIQQLCRSAAALQKRDTKNNNTEENKDNDNNGKEDNGNDENDNDNHDNNNNNKNGNNDKDDSDNDKDKNQ